MTLEERTMDVVDRLGFLIGDHASDRADSVARIVLSALKDQLKEERRRVKAAVDGMEPELRALVTAVIFPPPPAPVEKKWVDLST